MILLFLVICLKSPSGSHFVEITEITLNLKMHCAPCDNTSPNNSDGKGLLRESGEDSTEACGISSKPFLLLEVILWVLLLF